MSKPSPAPASPEFWRALAHLGTAHAPTFMWEAAAGDAAAHLLPFLTASPAAPPRVVPCPKCGAARNLSPMPDGTFILERPRHCTACTTERGLPAERFQPRALHHAVLAANVAKALSISTASRPQQPTGPLLPLGTFDRGPAAIPAYLGLTRDLHAAQHLHAIEPLKPPCALILPFPHAEELQTLRGRGLWVFRAAALLQVWPQTRIRGTTTLASAVTDFLAGTETRAPRPPVPLKGSRFEIAPDYSTVTALGRRPRVEQISNATTRAAIQVLVEAGAGSEAAALPKAPFVERVHNLTRPNRPPPRDPKPAHYFRHDVNGTLRPYAFYAQLVRRAASGGAYWLEM